MMVWVLKVASVADKSTQLLEGSCLYWGQVMHERFTPMAYRFRYGVMSVKVDVDRFAQEVKAIKGLSFNRFNVLSVYTKDYGSRDGQGWRAWMESLLAQYGVTEAPAKIELVAFPRFFGFVFNPLAMWYAYNSKQQLIAIVAEVSNTFGHWHHYVLTNQGHPLAPGEGIGNDPDVSETDASEQETSKHNANEQTSTSKGVKGISTLTLKPKANKVFHVSPFIGMACEYRFRFHRPGKTHQIGIYQFSNNEPLLVATQVGKAQPLTTQNILKGALKFPLNTFKVMIMIHWWALKIWLKGGKFHRTPETQRRQPYGHSAMFRR